MYFFIKFVNLLKNLVKQRNIMQFKKYKALSGEIENAYTFKR